MKHILLSCVESRIEHNRRFYSRFQLGPFDLGQGLTVGNAFRRTLLSELSGVGITLIEMEGVCHEYSTLPGVRESVLDILLNLKQLVLTSDMTFNTPQVGYLSFTGPGLVQAKHLNLPVSVSCVDPEQPIATLSSNAKLSFKFLVCQGKNYIIQTPVDKFHEYQKQILNSQLIVSSEETTTQISPVVAGSQNERLTARFQHQLNQLNRLKTTSFKSYTTAPSNKVGTTSGETFDVQTTTPPGEYLVEDVMPPKVTTFDLRENKLTRSTNSKSQSDQTTSISEDTDLKGAKRVTTSLAGEGVKRTPSTKRRTSLSQALPVDTLFMPVKQVNYMIDIDPAEPNRESVILEVWTNGSIHPRHAIHEAAKQLINLFSPFLQTHLVPSKVALKAEEFKTNLVSGGGKVSSNETNEQNLSQTSDSSTFKETERQFMSSQESGELRQQKLLAAIKTLDIANLDFSLRTFSLLKKEKINTISELVSCFTDQDTNWEISNTEKQVVLTEVEMVLCKLGLLETDSAVFSEN